MRFIHIASLVFLFAAGATLGADEAVPTAPTIQFHMAGKQPNDNAKATLLRLGRELLKSSNFNTVNQREMLKQSVPVIQDQYRSAVTGDYVLIRYDRPITVKTAGGDVKVFDMVIGLARPDYISSLFTVDDEGRVVAHAKYSGALAIEFKKAVATNVN